ncbi:MAG: hypothetical protein FJZ47_17030, partial [Candidatus Tectomicrobia bacterium]|nr:hypothetical protein [Candidatus Tectomicrobia bacterium]
MGTTSGCRGREDRTMRRRQEDGEQARTHQEVSALLPWYANGTLQGAELHVVELHLAVCPACQAELAQCHRLADVMRTAEAPAWSPSPARLTRLLARIEATEAHRTRLRASWEAVRAWGRACLQTWHSTPFAVRWMLAAQEALALLLLGLLGWQAPWTAPGSYRTLSDSVDQRAQPPAQGALRAVFAEEMTTQELQALLQRIGGTIVHGPSPQGVYTIGFTTTNDTAATVHAGV